MSIYDQSRPIGGMSFTDAAHFMRIHGRRFRPPPHMIVNLQQLKHPANESSENVLSKSVFMIL